MPAEDARLLRRTVKGQFELPRASIIGLKPVPLWRFTFEFGALPALRGIAEFHASVGKYFCINDPVAGLKLRVAITNLDLQSAVGTADTAGPIGWNLQKHLSVENRIIRMFELHA